MSSLPKIIGQSDFSLHHAYEPTLSEPLAENDPADPIQTTDQPVRLRTIKKPFTSSGELQITRKPYNRSQSVQQLTKKKALPIANEMHTMLFSSIGIKLYFHEKEAAAQLLDSYLHFRDSRGTMIEKMVTVREGLVKVRHLNRLDAVLTNLFMRKRSGELIYDYFKSLGEMRYNEMSRFAQYAIAALSKKQDLSSNILKRISSITSRELRTQTRDTLFREHNLSSLLCREYGNLLWREDLQKLCQAVKDAMSQENLSSLSLNYRSVEKELPPGQDIELILDEHAEQFSVFARTLLPKIFALVPPEILQTMFISRRKQIIDFLAAHPMTPPAANEDLVSASRPYISEILYLRIVNAQLIAIDDSPVAGTILSGVSKVLMCLAKETEFGKEKRNPIFERLNPLYEEFIDEHRRFVDACSLPSGIVNS
jgi:hypothetical protein